MGRKERIAAGLFLVGCTCQKPKEAGTAQATAKKITCLVVEQDRLRLMSEVPFSGPFDSPDELAGAFSRVPLPLGIRQETGETSATLTLGRSSSSPVRAADPEAGIGQPVLFYPGVSPGTGAATYDVFLGLSKAGTAPKAQFFLSSFVVRNSADPSKRFQARCEIPPH